MSYTAPALTVPVVLAGGYTPPSLTIPVVLGQPDIVTGEFSVTLPAVALPELTFAAADSPAVLGAFAASLPAVALPELTCSATGAVIYVAPSLSIPVVLQSPYTPPALTVPVVLGVWGRATTDGAFAATLPTVVAPLALAASGTIVWSGAFSAVLPPVSPSLTLTATGEQDLQLPDASGPRLGMPVQAALKTATALSIAQQTMLPIASRLSALSQQAEPIRVGASLLQQSMIPLQSRLAERHQHGLKLSAGAVLRQTETLRHQRGLRERHQHGLKTLFGAALRHADTLKTRNRLSVRVQFALPTATALPVIQQTALATQARLQIRWQQAEKPQPGRWWPRYEPPGLDVPIVLCQHPYTPRPLRCAVVLNWQPTQQPSCRGFDPTETLVIPIQETYIVINSFSLERADNGLEIDALDFSATLSADAWTWSWSASIPASQLSRVKSSSPGTAVELIATLNGTAIRLLVEDMNRSRRFAVAALTISGRGRAAWLAEPYAPILTTMNTESRTAQQLLADTLMLNGVSIGWAVDWQLEDWAVPAGLWSHTGTYQAAAAKIAESGGGYVQGHDTDQTLIILPWYPAKPWDWATTTPDIVLPEAVCVTEGIEWQDKPQYNAVWVVGGASGRRDKIKRTGSAGDSHAPTIVDPLATDPIMTRQRGVRVLADTGRQALISVSLPILPEVGIIKPGKLVKYTEQGVIHYGLSRAVSVKYDFPTTTQTVSLETHEL